MCSQDDDPTMHDEPHVISMTVAPTDSGGGTEVAETYARVTTTEPITFEAPTSDWGSTSGTLVASLVPLLLRAQGKPEVSRRTRVRTWIRDALFLAGVVTAAVAITPFAALLRLRERLSRRRPGA